MATKIETVKMECVSKKAGKVGTIANPPKKDQSAWEKAGWKPVKDTAPAK